MKIYKPILTAVLLAMAFVMAVIIFGLLVPQNLKMPVQGATKNSYNPDSFWYYPWGKSGTHKGIDIFAKEGTSVHSSTKGIVVFAGTVGMGGNVVVVLGPKWRMHYYAHLQTVSVSEFLIVDTDVMIGRVGTSGNAKGKPAHLHYVIATLIPYPWRIDCEKLGVKKAFYLNPVDYFEERKM